MTDDRALATGILGFIAILVVVALLYALMDPAVELVFNQADNATTSQRANTTVTRREQLWGAVPIYVMLLAGVFVIARAVRESGR